MIELVVFLGLTAVEVSLQLAHTSVYVLLLFPPFLFLRRHRLQTILLGAALSSVVCETIHGLFSGSLMLGVGVAILTVHVTVEVLDWEQPALQLVGLLGYLGIVAGIRVLMAYLTSDLLFFPTAPAWWLTFAAGCIYLLGRALLTDADTRRAART